MIEKVSTFKDRLNEALTLRNVRPVDLAKRANISESTVSQYRSGYAEPKEDKLAKIADVLKVNPTWLMGLNVSMELPRVVTKEYALAHPFDLETMENEMLRTRLLAYSIRSYWAFHILEVGDKLPQDGVNELVTFADYLASKYDIDKCFTPNEVDEALSDLM